MQYAMIMRSWETPMTEATKRVLQQIVPAAVNNRSLAVGISTGTNQPVRRDGDALTDYFVREAARAPRHCLRRSRAQAFLLGLAIGLDSSKTADDVAGVAQAPCERLSRRASA